MHRRHFELVITQMIMQVYGTNWHPHLFMSADMKRCGCQLVPSTWSFVNSGRDTRLTERDCDTFGRPLAPVSQANLLSCADTTRPNRVQLAGIWWDSLQSCPHNARISFRITLCGLYTADGVQQDSQSILYSVTIYAGNCMHFFKLSHANKKTSGKKIIFSFFYQHFINI